MSLKQLVLLFVLVTVGCGESHGPYYCKLSPPTPDPREDFWGDSVRERRSKALAKTYAGKYQQTGDYRAIVLAAGQKCQECGNPFAVGETVAIVTEYARPIHVVCPAVDKKPTPERWLLVFPRGKKIVRLDGPPARVMRIGGRTHDAVWIGADGKEQTYPWEWLTIVREKDYKPDVIPHEITEKPHGG